MGTKTLMLSTAGQRLNERPGFQVRSIQVDNLTNIWLFVQAGPSQYFVPPQTANHIKSVAAETIELKLENEPGMPAGRGLQTTQCTVIMRDVEMIPASGVAVIQDTPYELITPTRTVGSGVTMTVTYPATPGLLWALHYLSLTKDDGLAWGVLAYMEIQIPGGNPVWVNNIASPNGPGSGPFRFRPALRTAENETLVLYLGFVTTAGVNFLNHGVEAINVSP